MSEEDGTKCPHCGHIIKPRKRISGRTGCGKCGTWFIYDKEKFLEYSRNYANKPHVKKQRKQWEDDNREHMNKYAMNVYYEKHDKIREQRKDIHAIRRGVSAISLNGPCEICGKQKKNMARHHILPMAAGGKDCRENLVLVCRSCHGKIEGGIRRKIAIDSPNLFIQITHEIMEALKNE